MDSLWDEIMRERARQDRKFGCQRKLADVEWLPILVEEVGEVAKAINDRDSAQMRKELVEVCASALVWLECIDRRPPSTGGMGSVTPNTHLLRG